jgi:hypothetical protein
VGRHALGTCSHYGIPISSLARDFYFPEDKLWSLTTRPCDPGGGDGDLDPGSRFCAKRHRRKQAQRRNRADLGQRRAVLFADSDATKRTPCQARYGMTPKQEGVLGVAVEVNQNVKYGRRYTIS